MATQDLRGRAGRDRRSVLPVVHGDAVSLRPGHRTAPDERAVRHGQPADRPPRLLLDVHPGRRQRRAGPGAGQPGPVLDTAVRAGRLGDSGHGTGAACHVPGPRRRAERAGRRHADRDVAPMRNPGDAVERRQVGGGRQRACAAPRPRHDVSAGHAPVSAAVLASAVPRGLLRHRCVWRGDGLRPVARRRRGGGRDTELATWRRERARPGGPVGRRDRSGGPGGDAE